MVTGKIRIEIRNVYGEEKAYPVDTAGQLMARIAGTKTLTRSTLFNVLEMGLAVEVVDHYGVVCAVFRATACGACALPATIR